MVFQNLSGELVGQYELRDLLGTGGMGAVYRGWQPNLDREVAVKILPSTLAQQPDYMQRFVREAKTVASLEHANIVPVFDYGTKQIEGEAAPISYVVMRLLPGGSLAQRLEYSATHSQPLPSPYEIMFITRQLSSALDYAHRRGVIHRDVKPSNVMFDTEGTAFLVDFGVAKLLNTAQVITDSSSTLGTPQYMSPEQWKSGTIVPATDQYALGVMIYELFAGHLPFKANNLYELMKMHVEEVPTALQEYRDDLPDAVEAVILRAMAKDPLDRFPKMRHLVQALEAALEDYIDDDVTTGFFISSLPKKLPILQNPPPLLAKSPEHPPVQRFLRDLSNNVARLWEKVQGRFSSR